MEYYIIAIIIITIILIGATIGLIFYFKSKNSSPSCDPSDPSKPCTPCTPCTPCPSLALTKVSNNVGYKMIILDNSRYYSIFLQDGQIKLDSDTQKIQVQVFMMNSCLYSSQPISNNNAYGLFIKERDNIINFNGETTYFPCVKLVGDYYESIFQDLILKNPSDNNIYYLSVNTSGTYWLSPSTSNKNVKVAFFR